ncbi:hypothetical protein CB0940_09224 [Cercospora beticola]|uniref:Uncharacterized protein n=1 Tax=Cercospora beticola TaxID=122368 RepID=A0A2G5HHT4_CERBT|nr:hypothetical protein CB0940_09224 [Cercospora beticola]PIA92065.1 hypothetical protein CB0940_09224 [Cercospora beticola]WPB06472.1 hypothetical protein RHO25_011129 [Cercospora beticola]
MAKRARIQKRKASKVPKFQSRATTGDAATRVFGVPELPEHILLFAVAEQVLNYEKDDLTKLKFPLMPGSARESRGGVCLFQLQRVNKSFYGGIVGSPKLMRLILLAPTSNEELERVARAKNNLMPFHTPFLWILEMLELNAGERLLKYNITSPSYVHKHSKTRETILDIKFHNQPPETSAYKRAIPHATSPWNYPEASWRKIKICNAKVPLPFMPGIMTQFVQQDHMKDIGFVTVGWRFRESDTLGYAYDLIRWFFNHMATRFEAIRQVYQKAGEQEVIAKKEWWSKKQIQLKSKRKHVADHYFDDSNAGQDFRSQRSKAAEAALEDLDAELVEWKNKVRSEQAVRKVRKINGK